MMPRTKSKNAVFNEVGKTGVFIAFADADQEGSAKLRQEHDLWGLASQDAFVKIDSDPELKGRLKGKWFYINGVGSELSGPCTFNGKGELTLGDGNMENTVQVWRGAQPLSLGVYTDTYADVAGTRFVLDAYHTPDIVASVVVGVKKGSKVGTPEIEVSHAEEEVKLAGITAERLVSLRRLSEQELAEVARVFGPDSLPETRKLIEALRMKE